MACEQDTLAAAAPQLRKIIHIDMDCFYAAIEMRDHPELVGKPVAVGGRSSRRGVLTTCNYPARTFGCHSAMPTYKALQLCPTLIVMPTRFEVYQHESKRIRQVFKRFTDLIEPLSLDEAYLDVSHWRSSGAAVAREIRREIQETTGLTASAGIATNKLIAKIASDWRKPNGQFEVTSSEVDAFMSELSVRKLWGVGGKTAERLAKMGIQTCSDIRAWSLPDLNHRMGRLGIELYHLCRGEDDRPVRSSRERKSVSNERTYPENLTSEHACLDKLGLLIDELIEDLAARHRDRRIKSVVVKLKFHDFQSTTVERQASHPERDLYHELLHEGWERAQGRSVRLLGAGVRFHSEKGTNDDTQLELFGESA